MIALEAVFHFVDRVAEASVSIAKDDIFKVKKIEKEVIGDFPSVAVRLVDRKMIQYTSKVRRESLQELINDSKVKFSVKMRMHESYDGDSQGTIFYSSKFESLSYFTGPLNLN